MNAVTVTSATSMPITSDPDFVRLPPEERANVLAKEEAMFYIDKARNKSRACREIQARNGHVPGWSKVRLRVLYYEWLDSGRSWKVLANFARRTKEGWARKFVNVYKEYCEQNQRANRPAYKVLLRDFRRGKLFAGIGTWKDVWCKEHRTKHAPDVCPRDWLPAGLSYRNLQHVASLTPYEDKAVRIGGRAAKEFVPSVWTTRVGLLPFQVLETDDVWHDFKVNVNGRNDRAMRPLEYAIMDVASAARVMWAAKPELIREDGTVERLNTKLEFKSLMAAYLVTYGYRDDDNGTTVLGEHGTAALSQADRQKLLTATGGRFHFDASGIDRSVVHKGMFAPEGRGNFRFKALLEGGGGHLLAHNALAYLPAQVGSNSRTSGVEQLAKLDSYNAAIIKACAHVPAHKLKLIWSPVTPWVTAKEIIAAVYDALDNRDDHNMEGWEQNGWIVVEWRADKSMDWMPWEAIENMPPAQAEHCRRLAEIPGNSRTRRMSPREVLRRHEHEPKRVPMWGLVDFLGADFRRVVTVQKDGNFCFKDAAIGPDKHQYLGVIAQPDGSAARLRPGRDYALYVLPCMPDKAIVAEAETGTVLGLSLAVPKADRLNGRIVQLAQEMQATQVAAHNAPIQERHAVEAEEMQAGIAGNEVLLADLQGEEDADVVGAVPAGTGGGVDEALASIGRRKGKGEGNEW